MIALPPTDLILDTAKFAVLPPAVLAAGGFVILRFAGGARISAIASALALAAAVGVGFTQREVVPRDAATGWPEWPDQAGWPWLTWAALAALVAGLLARLPRLPQALVWLLRAGAANLAAGMLVSADLRAAAWWAVPAFAALVLAEWALLEELARRPSGGGVPLGLSFTCLAATAVIIHAHSARLADGATVLAAALGGLAIAAWLFQADAGGAMPAVAVLLPGLLLNGQTETFSEVPWVCFVLVALAPMVLAPTLLPYLNRWPALRLRLLQLGLLMIPLIVAVALAMQAEALEF